MKTFILLFALFYFASLPAQKDPPLHLEFEIYENEVPYTVLNLNEKGILLVMNQSDLKRQGQVREFSYYDKDFKLQWTKSYEIENVYNFLSYSVKDSAIFFILTGLPSQFKQYPFVIIKLNMEDGNIDKFYIQPQNQPKVEVNTAQIIENTLYYIYKDKDKYGIANVDLLTGKLSMQALEQENPEYCGFYADTSFRELYLLTRDKNWKEKDFFLSKYDKDLNVLYRENISIGEESLRLTDAAMQFLGRDSLLFMGTLHIAKDKPQSSSYDKGTQSCGVFSLKLENKQLKNKQVLLYHHFHHLDDLLDRESYYSWNKAKDKNQNKSVYFDFLPLVRMKSIHGKFALLVETYERNENTVSEMYYDAYGRMIPYSRTIFEGYTYKNAFVFLVDSQGDPIGNWIMDESMAKNTNRLFPLCDIFADSMGALMIAYMQEGFVYTQAFDQKGKAQASSSFRMESEIGDKPEKSWSNQLNYWYGDAWLCQGHMEISNYRKKGKPKRYVFFMDKLLMD